jgi:hypothetical protein
LQQFRWRLISEGEMTTTLSLKYIGMRLIDADGGEECKHCGEVAWLNTRQLQLMFDIGFINKGTYCASCAEELQAVIDQRQAE